MLSTMHNHSLLEFYTKLNSLIIHVYSKKVDALRQQSMDDAISSSQKEQLKKEFKTLESHVLHDEVFPRLLDHFNEICKPDLKCITLTLGI